MIKKILIIAAILMAAFFVIPEDSKADIMYHTKLENYNSGLANFLINTKVGRKIAYIAIRKSTKKKVKSIEKEVKKSIKKIEKSF